MVKIKFFLALTIVLLNLQAHSQNGDIHVQVNRVVDAINSKDSDLLIGMMSSECTIGDLEAVNHREVIPAILKNFNSIREFKVVKDSIMEQGYRFVQLSAIYSTGREGKPSFTFNQSGKLINLGIIKGRKRADAALALSDALKLVKKPDTMVIPFKLDNGLIYVPASLNDKPGYFLFDSGCPVALLNRKRIKSEKTVPGVSFDFMGMGGKMDSLIWSRESKINWGGLTISNLDAPAKFFQDSNADDSFLGILGYGVFSNYQLTIDYQNRRMFLERTDNLGKLYVSEINKGKLISSAALRMVRHIPVVNMEISGLDYLMGIDCGANANVIQEEARRKIGKDFDPESKATIDGVGASAEQGETGFLMGAKVAGQQTQDMYTVTTQQTIGAGTGSDALGIVGLLGTPFLNQFKVTLNFKAGTISFYR